MLKKHNIKNCVFIVYFVVAIMIHRKINLLYGQLYEQSYYLLFLTFLQSEHG